jgi:hypothetical protein
MSCPPTHGSWSQYGRGCRCLLTTFHHQVHRAGNVGPGDCPFNVYCTRKWCPSFSVARHSYFYESHIGQQPCIIGLEPSVNVEWLASLLLLERPYFQFTAIDGFPG